MTATITPAPALTPFDGDELTRTRAQQGITPAGRRARTEAFATTDYTGTLWERASDLDRFASDRRGTVLTWCLFEGNSRIVSPWFATEAEACEYLDTKYSEVHRRFFGLRVAPAPYETKSGRIVRRDLDWIGAAAS